MKKIFHFALLIILLNTGISVAAMVGDVDGDGKVNLSEAIYALQLSAGMRPDVTSSFTLNAYWPMHLGDTWQYRINGATTESRSIDSVYVNFNGINTFKFNYGGDYDLYSLDSNGLWIHKSAGSNYMMIHTPPQMFSPISFRIGDHVIISNAAVSITLNGNQISGSRAITIGFLSIEDITVPAGTFRNCMKFIRCSIIKDGNGTILDAYEDISWSAPNVGLVKQMRTYVGSPYTAELMSATVNSISYAGGGIW